MSHSCYHWHWATLPFRRECYSLPQATQLRGSGGLPHVGRRLFLKIKSHCLVSRRGALIYDLRLLCSKQILCVFKDFKHRPWFHQIHEAGKNWSCGSYFSAGLVWSSIGLASGTRFCLVIFLLLGSATLFRLAEEALHPFVCSRHYVSKRKGMNWEASSSVTTEWAQWVPQRLRLKCWGCHFTRLKTHTT